MPNVPKIIPPITPEPKELLPFRHTNPETGTRKNGKKQKGNNDRMEKTRQREKQNRDEHPAGLRRIQGKACHARPFDRKESLGRPLQHAGGTILACHQGKAVISVHFKRRTFSRGDIALIFADTPFTVEKTSRDFQGFQVDSSPELVDEATFTCTGPFFDTVYEQVVFQIPSHCLTAWKAIEEQLLWIAVHAQEQSRRPLARNTLQNFFIAMEMTLLKKPGQERRPGTRPRQIFSQFCNLVVEYCHKEHEVGFYAEKLCITPYYLYKTCLSIMKMSPKDIINSQLSCEIKVLLSSTNLSVKEIAQKSGFEEPSYMTRFFKRVTGTTPTRFRDNAARQGKE